MSEKNIAQEFKMKNLHETINYLVEQINQNELMSKKHKKLYRVLNYIELLHILNYTVSGCVFITAFGSLVGIPVGITSSRIWLVTCAKRQEFKSINQ